MAEITSQDLYPNMTREQMMAAGINPDNVIDPYLTYATAAEAAASGYGSPAEARFSEWSNSAQIGDTFDFYANAPVQANIGMGSILIGYTKEGKPILQTTQSEARTDWRGTISGSKDFDTAVQRLVDVGYSEQTAQFLVSKTGITDPNALSRTSNMNVTSNTAGIMGTTTGTTTGTSTTTNGLTGTQYNDRQSIYAAMADRFNRYGLTGLAEKIKQLAMDGASEATITLQLQDTPEYQMRFSANADRIKKGLTSLTPAEYVTLEDTYRQVLRAYGLNQFDNDSYVKQFIANDMSPTELSNRVVTAVQRVRNADPAIGNTLKDYYGISSSDLVAYVLDPNQQFQKIERQVAAAEIGTAARTQGLESGVAVAEQLAAQGITQAEAQKGYSTIADILPTATKLSGIYGNTMAGYDQSEAEQEVFNSLASAQRKRQQLGARETAQFKASSGITKTSLDTATKGNF